MNFRYIRMTFPEPLTEEQEETLRVNLDSIRDDTAKKLNRILHEIHHGWFFKGARAIPMNAAAITLLETSLTHLLSKFELYVFTEKEAPNRFAFLYARDEIALIKFKQARFASPIQELLVVEGLKRFVFPDMKVDPAKVILERGDTERL